MSLRAKYALNPNLTNTLTHAYVQDGLDPAVFAGNVGSVHLVTSFFEEDNDEGFYQVVIGMLSSEKRIASTRGELDKLMATLQNFYIQS